MQAAESTGSKVGTGGMKSKLQAAKTARSLGVPVFIGVGKGDDKLLRILEGKGDGTYITNKSIEPMNTKRQWIALHSETLGRLYVDQGAEEAILYNGRSLLPAGIFKVKGTFERGDVVEVYGMNGLLGKGEVNYSSDEVKKEIKKRHEERKTGVRVPSVEVIHRNRWIDYIEM